jgi:hypothetical protein
MTARMAIYEFDEEKPFSRLITIMDVAKNKQPDRVWEVDGWQGERVFVRPTHPVIAPSGWLGIVFEHEDRLTPGYFNYTLVPVAFVLPDEGGFWVEAGPFSSDWVQKQGLEIALYIEVQRKGRIPLTNGKLLIDSGIWVEGD